ncbi:MAG TPA: hypothetical protein PLC89_28110 [Haliscomenobacter sp.]|uniref:hypothetical protein n=1 Tax=Haliscomenobacter sp. TaxID=2717303 RepID=UPI002C9982EA|nr:hypothetical protein [Haliscomenobacter sp.]HOY21211.1 hypothetical protein [Haliscomenobacter sp.]
MKSIIKFFFFISILAFSSCETEIIERLDEFSFETGGYMRTVEFPVPAYNVSKANMAGTKFSATLEAVTANFGAEFSSYDLVVRFVDKTAANGSNNKADVVLKSYAASVFAKDPTTQYPRTTLSITGKEMQDALKLTDAEIAKGDQFEVRGTMKLTNGKSYNAVNSSPDITGGAFYNSPFLYRANVID